MNTYEIKYEPIIVDGVTYDKYNIYYYCNDIVVDKEFHSYDGINGYIRPYYTPKQN